MEKLRVGVVGCGEAAQILHLPSLYQLDSQYEVTAICDVSETVLEGVGSHWNIDRRFQDSSELVQSDEVDVVLVTNPHPHHATVTLAALEAGKHVLVEKPMCLTLEEADRIIEKTDEAGTTVQVGYMRRYAPAFLDACEKVRNMRSVNLVRVHDVIGANAQIIEPTSRVIRGSDVPDSVRQETSAKQNEDVVRSIGNVSAEVQTAYMIMLGLSSHDFSAMRELIGVPERVLYAAHRNGGRYITGALDYGAFVCQFETGIDEIARFDAHLEVYGPDQVIRIDYDTPYVRNLPTTLTEKRARDRHSVEEAVQYDWGDNFVEEWRDFHRNATQDLKPKCSPQDYREDLELIQEIVRQFETS